MPPHGPASGEDTAPDGVQAAFWGCQAKSSYQNDCAAARRARPVLGILMCPRTLRFLRAVRTHLTTARYVLLAALRSIAYFAPSGDIGGWEEI